MAPSKYILLTVCYFYIANYCLLFAQTAGYDIQVQTRFVQRFEWMPDEYALHYEVEIEREENGIYRRFLLEETENAFIQVTLPPGNFRYRVIPYDLFNRPGMVSNWLDFVINPAINPHITGFSPDIIYLGRMEKYTLSIFGNNFLDESEISLFMFGTRDVIIPAEVLILSDGTEAQLIFTGDQLAEGAYQVLIKNPGGLEASIAGVVVIKEVISEEIVLEDQGQAFNFYLGASYLTLLNIHGGEDWMTASGQYLSGAALRLGIVSSNFSFFNVGVEVVPAWYSFSKEAQSLLLECNLLLQKEFFSRKTAQRIAAALVFRTGAGINMDFIDPETETAFYINMGFSFFWFPVQRFYLEAGVNYSYLFGTENPAGRLKPFAGVGLRFGR